MIIAQFNPPDGSQKCLACNWEQVRLYATGLDEATAYQFYQQNGGLCAECMLRDIYEQDAVLEVHEAESL